MVNLTRRQQSLLAELVASLRHPVYQLRCGAIPTDVTERFHEWVERGDVKPQEMDEISDIMHRTGE